MVFVVFVVYIFFINIISKSAVINMLKRLLPKMLPSDNKGFFNSIDDVHVINSGNAVTPARSRPPITAFDMVLVLLRLSAYIDSLMLKYIVKNANIKKNISFTVITY